jgi:hypothetical protein
MQKRPRKKLPTIRTPAKAAQWDFWKSRQGKFAARFSLGIDGLVLPFVEQLPARFPHIVFGLSATMRAQRKHLSAQDPRATYWHKVAVRFSAKLDARATLDAVFDYLRTVARCESGFLSLPDIPKQLTERRAERAKDVRKRLRRRRTYASF